MSTVRLIGTWVSTLACLVVIVSFGLWAGDEGRDGSNTQIARLQDGVEPVGTQPQTAEQKREASHSAVREKIDDVNDVLVSPFANVVQSDNDWAKRIAPLVLALLAYGLLFRVLLNYLPR